MYRSFLIKYAEIGVKGKNRYLFEDRLCDQIRYALTRCEGAFEVTKSQGRIFVNALSEFDYEETVENLRTVFGVTGICPVVHVEDEGFEKLCQDVPAISTGCTRTRIFHSRSRRAGQEKTIRKIPWRSTVISGRRC